MTGSGLQGVGINKKWVGKDRPMVTGISLCIAFAFVAQQQPAAPAPEVLSGFKVAFRETDVANRVLHNGEMIVMDGRWYRVRNIDNEVVIVDPKRARIEIIDLLRKIQSNVTFERLEERTALLKKTLLDSIAKREAKGDRANRVAAQMARELTEPKFKITRDPSGRSVKLVNETVQIEIKGEPDENPKRAEAIAFAIIAYAKLEAMRDPTKIPPFPQIDALNEVAGGLKLRPTEMTCIYRMAGKPIKQKWIYQFAPSLTDRESSAIRRIIEAQSLSKPERFETFEQGRPR